MISSAMESNAWGTTSPSVLAVFILITPRCCRGCYPNKHPSLILEFSGSAVRLATPEPPGEVSGLPMPPVAARQNAGHRSAPCLSNRNACHLAPLTKGGRLLLCRSFPSLLSPARAGLFFFNCTRHARQRWRTAQAVRHSSVPATRHSDRQIVGSAVV
jgi:hypothetical protein